MKQVYCICPHWHWYTGSDQCPLDGWSSPDSRSVVRIVQRLMDAGRDVSLIALAGAGIREGYVSRLSIIEYGDPLYVMPVQYFRNVTPIEFEPRKHVYCLCNGGEWFTSSSHCTRDGWSSQDSEDVYAAVKKLSRRRKELSLAELKGCGVRETYLKQVIVIEYGSPVLVKETLSCEPFFDKDEDRRSEVRRQVRGYDCFKLTCENSLGGTIQLTYTVAIERNPDTNWLVADMVELPGIHVEAPDARALEDSLREAIKAHPDPEIIDPMTVLNMD